VIALYPHTWRLAYVLQLFQPPFHGCNNDVAGRALPESCAMLTGIRKNKLLSSSTDTSHHCLHSQMSHHVDVSLTRAAGCTWCEGTLNTGGCAGFCSWLPVMDLEPIHVQPVHLPRHRGSCSTMAPKAGAWLLQAMCCIYHQGL
jgi:hypothetical protein